MMFPKKKNANSIAGDDILILTDCINGAMTAARFAIRNLYTSNSSIILLQTYQKQGFGQSTLRNVLPLLKKIATSELTNLKNEIVKDFGIEAESISKIVKEGKLSLVLKKKFENRSGIILLLGIDPKSLNSDFHCKKLIKSVFNSGIRPAYLISDSIIRIEEGSITYFACHQKKLKPEKLDILRKTLGGKGLNITTVFPESDFLSGADDVHPKHPVFQARFPIDDFPKAEKLFRKLISVSNGTFLQATNQNVSEDS